MTPEEVERIVKKTLGRPVDLSNDYVENLRRIVAAYDATLVAKAETIALLRSQLEMYRDMVDRLKGRTS